MSGPLTRWCASTLGADLLCSPDSRVSIYPLKFKARWNRIQTLCWKLKIIFVKFLGRTHWAIVGSFGTEFTNSIWTTYVGSRTFTNSKAGKYPFYFLSQPFALFQIKDIQVTEPFDKFKSGIQVIVWITVRYSGHGLNNQPFGNQTDPHNLNTSPLFRSSLYLDCREIWADH